MASNLLLRKTKPSMNIKNNILETIGNTPLIRLNKITKELPCTVLAKVDYFNPGNSRSSLVRRVSTTSSVGVWWPCLRLTRTNDWWGPTTGV